MRIYELTQSIAEESYRSLEIEAFLIQKGYEKVGGSGADQDAYLEPGTGKVLKIFGADPISMNLPQPG